MTKPIRWLAVVVVAACIPLVPAQGERQTRKPARHVTQSSATDSQINIKEYIDLLQSDVRQDKAAIMGAMMQLDIEDAAKFWPIYSEYDAELVKVNNLRRDNIQEYSRTYRQLTDEKADELVRKALDYQKQRSELFERYYEKIKESLGAITAARFAQIEYQLLSIIDLQIASALPIAGQQ